MGACTSSRIGKSFRRINTYHAFCQELKLATDAFYAHFPLSSGVDNVIPPLALTYFAYEGKREAEDALKQALETSEEYLKGQTGQSHQIPNEKIVEVPWVWQKRQELLFRLGDMERLEKECRFCLSHYKDNALRQASYVYLITALSARKKTSEAQMLLDQHGRTVLRSADTLTLSTYLAMARGNKDLALKGFEQLLSSTKLSRHERAILLRRQADFARRHDDTPLAILSLEALKSLLSLKSQKERIDIELWTLSPRQEQSEHIAQWIGETKDRGALWHEAIRQLRNMAYNEGDLYKALLLHERTHWRHGGIQGLQDSLRYVTLSRIRPDLETIYKYEHRSLFKHEHSPTQKSLEDRKEDKRSFREIWGNVREHDFWAMSSDQPAFGGQTQSTPKLVEAISIETYQSALIRVALTCIELLSSPEQARMYLQKCIKINPNSPDGRYASELLLKI